MNKPASPAAADRGLTELARPAPATLPKKPKGQGAEELAQAGLLAAEGVEVAEAGTAASAGVLAGSSPAVTSAAPGTVITGVDSIVVAGASKSSWLLTLGIWGGTAGAISFAGGGSSAGGGANLAPTSAAGSASGSENDASISGQAAGADANGGTLTYSVVGVVPAGLTFNADGSFSYVPQAADHALAGGASRTVSFNYVVSDGSLTSSPATITLTLAGANDAPVAGALAVAGSEDDAAVTGSVAASDAEGDALTYSTSGSTPATLTFNPDGSFSYVPQPGDGTAGPGGTRLITFSYVANDGLADSAPGTVTITLNGVNDAPVANAAAASGSENDASIAGAVSASDADGHGLSYSLASAAPAGLTFHADGTFTYVPQAIDQGLDALESRVFSFDYVANDGLVDSAPATVTITVSGSNDNPVTGGAGSVAFAEDDAPITGQVPVATDIDGEAVIYKLVNTAPPGLVFNTDGSGSFTYSPQAADQALDSGETRPVTFQYLAYDGTGNSATATVTITVSGANDAPVANPSTRTGPESAAVIAGAVSATDVDGEPQTYSLVGAAPDGLTFNANGTYAYVPQAVDDALDAGESRTFTFDFTANDGSVESNAATVSFVITGVNDAPVATDGSLTGAEDDASLNGSVPTATDVDGEALTYALAGDAPAGLSFASDGTFVYVMQAEDEALDTGEARDLHLRLCCQRRHGQQRGRHLHHHRAGRRRDSVRLSQHECHPPPSCRYRSG
jgi:VCBS repeat-containing protein